MESEQNELPPLDSAGKYLLTRYWAAQCALCALLRMLSLLQRGCHLLSGAVTDDAVNSSIVITV